MTTQNQSTKQAVHDFWNDASCGETLYLAGHDRASYETQATRRFELEPFILDFAKFDASRGSKVLEIGVGLGADHQRFAAAGAELYGIDLTERAVLHTRHRLGCFGLVSQLAVGDAENLAFPDNHFDSVYSWGVIHHSPDTQKAVHEIFRVLKPGGKCNIMIYHKYSLIGFMLWIRYALLTGHFFTSLETIYSKYLESPGTKAYSVKEARVLFREFERVSTKIQLTHGDLLISQAGQQHQGKLLNTARMIWPSWFFKKFCQGYGLFTLIRATKAA